MASEMADNQVLFVRSSKKNGNKSTEGNSSTNEDDIWDDTLLIKAYDKAVQLAQKVYLKKNQPDGELNSKGNKHQSNKASKHQEGDQKWKVGDKCKCQYSEDLQFYEADIIEILGSSGMCIVKYVGYENEEKVPLKKLKPSEGEVARAKQCKEALDEHDDQNMEVENDMMNSSQRTSKASQKKSSNTRKDGHFRKRIDFSENNFFSSLNFPLPDIGSSIIPPPPPPHMFQRLNEDEKETEAMSAMLMSWYMSGYHTGYYQGLKMAKKQ